MKSVVYVVVAGLSIAVAFVFGGLTAAPIETPQINPVVAVGERYVTHVSTDKPIYRTGEKVYVRSVVLHTDGHTPMTNPGTASFEIKGPNGDTVASGGAQIIDSVVGFSWHIPWSQAGGEYIVRISTPFGDTPAERKFDVRAYRAPRLKSQIVFARDGYGPGDTVSASLHVERAEGGVPTGAKVSVGARVDNVETWNGTITVDAAGNASANFKLPATIVRGEGVIAMTIADGGIIETATKTIPILLQTLDLVMYPEGDDLVAGLPNRVYVEGRTPAKKPADMAGVIVNSAGREVASFRTEHEGRGRFSFVPVKGEKYSLRVNEPAGIKTVFPLPVVKESGVVISSASDVTPREKDVVVRIASTADGEYSVALSQHEKEIAFKRVALKASQFADAVFSVPRSLDGVIVATVYDGKKIPKAERLLFRQPEHHIKVKIVADRADYVPGDKVTLRITTTDEAGKPIGSVVGLTVTDSSVLEMIDKREQAPRLPVMVLLESEVKEFAEAHVYLDETNPKASLATDLLLGTQGWRRFASAGAGSLKGVITDASNAVIPGVTVRVMNTVTGAVLSVVSDERGAYTFGEIKAGAYRLSALLPGFQTNTANVRVTGFADVRKDLRMQVATVAEMVQVEAFFGGVPAGFAGGRALEIRRGARLGESMPMAAPAPPVNQIVAGNLIAFEKEEAGFNEKRDRAGLKRIAVDAHIQMIREYAHTLRPDWSEDSRIDFAETVYWSAGVKTDNSTGLATVSFNLSDSVTSFRAIADAFAGDGSLGSGVSNVESVKPFSIEPKIPLQITSGDVIQLPVGVINGLSRRLDRTELTAKAPGGIKITLLGDNSGALTPKERSRRFMQLKVGREFSGLANLTLDAAAGNYHDSVSRTLDVQPLGFPHENSTGGMLTANGSRTFEFSIPDDMIRGSISTNVTVYPTPLASMTDALQSLLRQPNGCFEQTSSTSYPLVMTQQYFLTHTGVDPALVEKARNLLDVSYKKLVGFESPTKGYEWFGADPGHEALTAYGLMQFTDMSQVRDVDKQMVARTRNWLLARRDGKGGFSRNSRVLDTFGGAPADTTNAYIVWALIESGEKGLEREVAAVKASAASTQDSYIIALAANILAATGDSTGARQLMDKLAKNQETNGNVRGAGTSITRSGGEALNIETTALSVLAWMREPSYTVNVQKGLKWIVDLNKSGRFGSTQSTILALRTIVAYDAAHARPKAPGRMILSLDGKPVGAPVAFTAGTRGAIVLPEVGKELGPGKHTLTLQMEDGSEMPASMSVKYHSLLSESAEQAQAGIQVVLKDPQIQEGSVTEAIVSITNKSDRVIPTPVAIVGIPGGLEVRHDQLKELVKSRKIDAYEVMGREVVLYWRYLKAREQFAIPLSVVAAIPGTYTGPASRAYLYYTDEFKSWAPGLKVTITSR